MPLMNDEQMLWIDAGTSFTSRRGSLQVLLICHLLVHHSSFPRLPCLFNPLLAACTSARARPSGRSWMKRKGDKSTWPLQVGRRPTPGSFLPCCSAPRLQRFWLAAACPTRSSTRHEPQPVCVCIHWSDDTRARHAQIGWPQKMSAMPSLNRRSTTRRACVRKWICCAGTTRFSCRYRLSSVSCVSFRREQSTEGLRS